MSPVQSATEHVTTINYNSYYVQGVVLHNVRILLASTVTEVSRQVNCIQVFCPSEF